jgi:hypothetical protein
MANAPTMPRPKSDKDSHLSLMLPGTWLEEADALAERRSSPGMTYTRSDILRMALRNGLDALALESPKGKKR